MKYTSGEMNSGLKKVCDQSELYEAFEKKAVPYIGNLWYYIDFDQKEYGFGVMNIDGVDCVGFMENNKWGCNYIQASREEWNKVKKLVTHIIDDPSPKTLRNLNNFIQGLLAKPQIPENEYWREEDGEL